MSRRDRLAPVSGRRARTSAITSRDPMPGGSPDQTLPIKELRTMQGFYADPADDVTHAAVSDPTAVPTREAYAHVDGDMGSLYLQLIERPDLTLSLIHI